MTPEEEQFSQQAQAALEKCLPKSVSPAPRKLHSRDRKPSLAMSHKPISIELPPWPPPEAASKPEGSPKPATAAQPKEEMGRETAVPEKRAQQPSPVLPPLPSQVSPLVFIVKKGGYFFGAKFELTIKQNSLSFVNPKTKDGFIFDPAVPGARLTLRTPWVYHDKHIAFVAVDKRLVSFSIPLKAYPAVRAWYEQMKTLTK